MEFIGKAVLVTGASSGIGLAIAEEFCREGAEVGVCGIPGDELTTNKVCDDLSAKGCRVKPFHVDVADEESVMELLKDFIDTYKKIDVLVNNAGIYIQADAESARTEDWERILNVNLTGAFLTIKHAIPFFKKQGGGAIVNIGSEAGIVGLPNQVAYNVSKAGIVALTKSCALDFADDGIRVNCVCPGTTETPLVTKSVNSQSNPDEARRKLASSRPAKRLGKPEEIARAVLMMADDRVAYATGSVFSIDGGYTAQ